MKLIGLTLFFTQVYSSIVNLGLTNKCQSKLSLWDISYLSDYGCFCGYFGASGGGYPRDHVDSCCKEHDECYTVINSLIDGDASIIANNMTEFYNYAYEFECKEKVRGENTKSKVKCANAKAGRVTELNKDSSEEAIGVAKCQCDAGMAKCLIGAELDYDMYKYRSSQGLGESCYEKPENFKEWKAAKKAAILERRITDKGERSEAREDREEKECDEKCQEKKAAKIQGRKDRKQLLKNLKTETDEAVGRAMAKVAGLIKTTKAPGTEEEEEEESGSWFG